MDSSDYCEARLKIAVGAEAATALARALGADNISAPPGITVTCSAASDYLVCDIIVRGCGDPKKVLSLRNTVDDLLISLKAASESLGSLAGRSHESRRV